jgi:hypothetical protein
MRDAALLETLRAALHAAVDDFVVADNSGSAGRSQRRLRDVAEYSPAFLALLGEPWMTSTDAAVSDTLLQCAYLHLYARVLDDALDENLPVDRLHLLRIQPLFWRAVYGLGARYPALLNPSAALIGDTVLAISADDCAAAPRYWGSKNHHLLLAPLLLSGDDAAYRAVRPGLSSMIAMAQALDEMAQGAMLSRELAQAILDSLPAWLEADQVAALERYGWHGAAQRLLRDGRVLLQKLEQQGYE